MLSEGDEVEVIGGTHLGKVGKVVKVTEHFVMLSLHQGYGPARSSSLSQIRSKKDHVRRLGTAAWSAPTQVQLSPCPLAMAEMSPSPSRSSSSFCLSQSTTPEREAVPKAVAGTQLRRRLWKKQPAPWFVAPVATGTATSSAKRAKVSLQEPKAAGPAKRRGALSGKETTVRTHEESSCPSAEEDACVKQAQELKQRKEEETKQKEQAAALAMMELIQKVRAAMPENYNELRSELFQLQEMYKTALGSLAEEVSQQAEQALKQAQQRVDDIHKMRAEEKLAQELSRKRAEQELRRKEGAAALAVLKLAHKVRLAMPETYDKLRKELQQGKELHLAAMGSLGERVTEEAERALKQARKRVDDIEKKRAQVKLAEGLKRKREEEELKRKEGAAALAVMKLVQKVRLAMPENYDQLRKELQQVQERERDALGSLAEKISQEAEHALKQARKTVLSIVKKRAKVQGAQEMKQKREQDELRLTQQSKAREERARLRGLKQAQPYLAAARCCDALAAEKAAIHFAAEAGDADAILELGPDSVNLLDACGRSPLRYAVRGGRLDAVKILLQLGADANLPSRSGRTPLMSACGRLHSGIISLLKPLSDPKAVDRSGRGARYYAMQAACEAYDRRHRP